MTDSPFKTGVVSVFVAASAAMLEVLAHTAAMQTGISEIAHTILDASIVGIAAGVAAWLLFSATRARRRRVLEHMRVVAELNHHVRNALEVIIASHYLEEPKRAEVVLESVHRIDNVLRELFPTIGERTEDRQSASTVKLRRGRYTLQRRQSEHT